MAESARQDPGRQKSGFRWRIPRLAAVIVLVNLTLAVGLTGIVVWESLRAPVTVTGDPARPGETPPRVDAGGADMAGADMAGEDPGGADSRHDGPGDGAAAPQTRAGGAVATRAGTENGLLEESPHGLLPRIDATGLTPRESHAGVFDRNDLRPRVAVIVKSLGLARQPTKSAIDNLPAGVTLSFQPYGATVADWMDSARAAGHEILLDLPMEPADFPDSDPGPRALLTSLDAAANRDRLHWVLGRGTGYVGVITFMGDRFLDSAGALEPVLEELGRRGLLLVDNGTPEAGVAADLAARFGLPRAFSDRFIGRDTVSAEAIDLALAEVADLARQFGAAVLVVQPVPVIIDRLRLWLDDLEESDVALAPVTAVVNLQRVR